jgi:hypothetical protein
VKNILLYEWNREALDSFDMLYEEPRKEPKLMNAGLRVLLSGRLGAQSP